ncbi:MAG: adenylate/guanylate cyclase domain-containing protein, partial [Deltaproteobacteria bacterium]
KQRLYKISENSAHEIKSLRTNEEFIDYYRMVFHQNMIPPGQKTIYYKVDGIQYISRLNTVNFDDGKRWLSVIVAKEDDFVGVAKRARTHNMIIGIIFTVLALLLGMFIASRIVGRLRELVIESQKVKVMQLDDNTSDSNFKEIHEVLQAFEGMKTGLRAFKKYVPVNLVRKLITNKTEPTLGGVPKTLTILFSDIQDFTSISEKLSPTELGNYLGDYLTIVAGEVLNSEGTVDKYIGDAVMAFWGAPNEVENQAQKACEAALLITKKLEQFHDDHPDMPVFHTRIGIHTDNVVVGNFGSTERLNYTVIGDGVNLASRIEGVNKFFGTQILISEDTKNLIGEDFECRKMGEVEVKGRSKPAIIYELVGHKSEMSLPQTQANRLLEEAVEFFEKGNPQAAFERLNKAKALAPDDKVIHCMEKFIKETQEGEHYHQWSGVIKVDSK